jgi:hypothetical protein
MLPQLLNNEIDITKLFQSYRGAMYVGFVSGIPTERVAAATGATFLTFDVAVGTSKKLPNSDKWESIFVQCSWFGDYTPLCKGDVVAVFGSPDITIYNGKAYPKLKVRAAYVVQPSRGGSAERNLQYANKMQGRGAGYSPAPKEETDEIPF